ncbi:MAG TPA: HAMP domain-containing sensor histidine kinase [Rubricoccaceae bacterium]
MFRPAVAALFLLVATFGAAAQPVPSSGEGRPLFARRISWRESGGNAQNWAFAQRPDGRLYVANTEGILEYDGVDWRLYQTAAEQRFLIHSVAIGPSGRVYAGGIGDVGMLEPDASGTLHHHSLTRFIAPGDRVFTDVWTTHATQEGIVFQSYERLFRWDGHRMEAWPTPTRFRSSFLVRGRVHVWEDGVGIKQLGPRGLSLIPGGGAFAGRKVDARLADGNGWMAVVRDEGLVAIDAAGRSRAVGGAASDYLRTFRPYAAIAVPNRYTGRGALYAVATFGGGVALVTPDGRLLRVYREDAGMTLGDDILGLQTDAQGGLWVALQNGIVRIDLFPRHTWFDEADGLLGSPNALVQHGSALYVGTDAGVFRQVPGRLGRPGADAGAYSRFEPVAGFPWDRMQVWDIASTAAGLIVAARDGLYAVEGRRVQRVLSTTVYSITPVTRRPDILLVGTADGVARVVRRGGQWVPDGVVGGITGETRFMQEDARGAMWIAQPGGNLYRVAQPQHPQAAVQTFGPAEGLTSSAGPLNLVGPTLVMSTRDGVFRVEPAGRRVRLVREPAFAHLGGAYSLFSPDSRNPWTFSDGILRSGDRLGFEIGGLQPNDVLTQAPGVAWVATSDGLLRFDAGVRAGQHVYPAMVRRVTNRDETVLFGGDAFGPPQRGIDLDVPIRAARGLRIEVAAALFDRPGQTEFSTRLLGSDDEAWGPWTRERVSQFVGIREGTYTFEVRARDDIGHETAVAALRMRVLPPWYRTWWAYTLYALSIGGVIWGVSAWRLRAQRLRLEAARARNQRMQRLSARLQETNTRLRRADKLKDDLLANTSHELRTPLTAILGFSEMLLDEADAGIYDLAEGIQRGGQRLLGTVDSLLDMFKLQSGTVEVFLEEADAAQAVRECVRSIAPLAERRGLVLSVRPEGLVLPAAIDRGALDRILAHVVGNAVKFTDAGSVTVLVDATDHELHISVADTGIGIPDDQIGKVFEPFEQVSTGFSRSYEGNGLGLSIVRGLVDTLGGSVDVESTIGAGTTVRIALPRWGDLHAAPQRSAAQRSVAAASSPALGGAQILSVGLGADGRAVRSWIAPQGTVCETETAGQAVREARKLAYDAVFVAAADEATERKRVALLRSVPGYAHLPVLRVGGDALAGADLAARGFTHQLALPLDADAVVTLLEALLMTIEEAIDD